jgi:hypothetical protein
MLFEGSDGDSRDGIGEVGTARRGTGDRLA